MLAGDAWQTARGSDRRLDCRQRRPLVRQRVRRLGCGDRMPNGSPTALAERSWRTIVPRAATTRRRRSRRSPIRGWPSGSRSRSTAVSQTPGAREITPSMRTGPRLVDVRRLHLPAADHRAAATAPTIRSRIASSSSRLPPSSRSRPTRWRACRSRWGRRSSSRALTRDAALIDRLLASPLVDRLNVGPIPTNQISWDQPHEGNLFEHLYARRSFQQQRMRSSRAGGRIGA